ncbi:MAG TPA: hypothetical protein VNS09_16145 [Solirubrobacter sp.]|nr:hypothetical protein [Solirubrobacter sp.]
MATASATSAKTNTLLGALIRPIINADSLAQAHDRLSEAVAHVDCRLSQI